MGGPRIVIYGVGAMGSLIARMILDNRLQIAARALGRSGGRYTTLTRARASSCRVCSADDTPLWEIRARRVVHDTAAQLVYFEGAQLRFGGVPVIWVPSEPFALAMPPPPPPPMTV